MVDDILPPPWRRMRREMLGQLRLVWWCLFAMCAFEWAVLPWRFGWRGVALAAWTTFWFSWGKVIPMLVKRLLDGAV